MDRAIALLVVIAATDAYLSWRLTWPVLRAIRDAGKHHGVDVSGTVEPPPTPVAESISELTDRGFARIGEARADLGRLGRPVSWHMVDDTRTVVAEIVPGQRGALVAFTTLLSDEAVVMTTYRFGETFATPGFVATACRTSIEEALALHRRNVDDLLRKRGATLSPVRTMGDALEAERVYRRRHFRRYMRPGLIRSLLTVLAINTAAAGAIAGSYLVSRSPLDAALLTPILIVGVAALILTFVFYAGILSRAEQ